MSMMASQITNVSTACSIINSGTGQRKHQSSVSLAFVGVDSPHHDDVPGDDVIKWKHFPWYWPFVRGIHRSPVNSPHKGQWSRALMFSLICTWINGWVNNREAGDLRCHRGHYVVTVMQRTSNVENVSIVWHHHDHIQLLVLSTGE